MQRRSLCGANGHAIHIYSISVKTVSIIVLQRQLLHRRDSSSNGLPCACLCMPVHVCVYLPMSMNICLRVSPYVNEYMSACICLCQRIYVCVYLSMSMNICLHVSAYVN